jgi:carbonic anhydrase/acetyltransferase-like protein (isoleucine patch superfamily)
MGLLMKLNGHEPQLGENCWLAPSATIVGEVRCGDECTFWFNAVVRGDVNAIIIGDRTNVQDNAVIHCTYEKAATSIGSDVSIGHSAIVHGCTLHDNVLVGMGAIIMDNVVVNSGAIIAAGAVVLEGTIVEAGAIYAGIPAKKVKMVAGDAKTMISRIAKNYPKYASWYKS